MGFETGSTYISQLVAANPTASDDVSEGDDHLRMMKTVLKTQFHQEHLTLPQKR